METTGVPSSYLAMPHRLSVSLKLGAIFLVLATLAAGNLYFSERLHDSVVDMAGIINQSGRLRYLSQQIALRSAGLVLEPDADAGQMARASEDEFELHYAGLVRRVGDIPSLMHSDGDGLEERLERIGRARLLQHAALEEVLAGPDPEARRLPNGAVAAWSVLLLKETDRLVGALDTAVQTGHRRADAIIFSVQTLEVLLMLGIFFYVRSRITAPILKLAEFTRRFAAGERAVRLDFHSGDEIGELVLTFNTTAAQTAGLIEEIDRRAQENAALAERLQASLDFHLKLLQEFPNPIWRVDRDGRGDYVNRAWLKFTGRALEQELGDGWADGIHPEDRERCLASFLSTFNRREPIVLEYRMRHRDGSYHWLIDHGVPFTDLDGEFAGYLGTCYDIEERKQYQTQLEYQAQHDTLTGLPNRNLLADRIDQAIGHARRHGSLVAVLFLDLDNFKVINDSLGHETGDRLLVAVGERLAAAVRAGDTVARHGGDEFVVVLCGMAQEENVANAARKLMAAMAAPFILDGRDLVVTASLGVALYPRDGDDQLTLLRNADTALYRAKDSGRDTFQFYAAEMNQRVLARLNLERDLRQALERGEFLLHYQPQVDLASGAIIGAEALARWRHPERGLVLPGEFIPLAEETGLIVPLGEWVLREACRQTRAWRDAGFPELRISVNLSARQFRAPGLTRTILDALAETGLEARLLELEITESTVMHDPEGAIAVLEELEKHGVAFAVDDFGTGYSSLNYLKRLPIHKLKIDQSFVRNITTDTGDAAIATAVIELAHSLKLKVIAEGVETEEQRAFLRMRQCDEMQGYFFSRPLPAAEMDALLSANKQSCWRH
ncbi:MAG: EAL domain-containing protein [Candidatus Nitricoxidivorans perseverans]|uniref:EAL domain-containing protein n=1 Tax=Candidatus Nitricoxidivorans perseverans TaxID=2975601 RepID=A0AA49FJM7_9PROT|nr:MAG: EAL domain-containing protein [Candidatus Nitricoxidivorans perseverans]